MLVHVVNTPATNRLALAVITVAQVLYVTRTISLFYCANYYTRVILLCNIRVHYFDVNDMLQWKCRNEYTLNDVFIYIRKHTELKAVSYTHLVQCKFNFAINNG